MLLRFRDGCDGCVVLLTPIRQSASLRMFLVTPVSVSARWPAAIIAFLFVAFFLGVPAAVQQNRVETALRLGAEAMHRGKAGEAEKFFREVTQLAEQLADG